MKCARCLTEMPNQAQFCMKCGTPVVVRQTSVISPVHTGPLRSTLPLAPPKKSNPLLWIAAILLILGIGAAAAVAYMKFRNPTNRPDGTGAMGRLTDLNGRAGDMGGLLDKSGRVGDPGPLINKGGQVSTPPSDPTDVIDWLKHLRETERARLTLTRQQMALILNLSSTLPAGNMTAEMGENPEAAHKEKYNKMQADFAAWATDWENLTRKFLAYPKPVPASCVALRDKYLQAISKTSASISKVGNSFATAMGGNPSEALDALTKMQGDQGIEQACELADVEFAAVCDKFHLHKDFDIRAEGGASNPFGVGR